MTAASPAPSAAPAASGKPPRRPKARPSPAARRVGYVIAAVVNVAFWVAIHVWPGWQEVSFLTARTSDVLPWVDTQIAVAVAANAIWLVADPRWLRALGEAVTALVGIAATVRILTVFPFSFADGVPWQAMVRFALWVAIVGAAIGVVTNVVALVRALGHPDEERTT